jgi:hypothetical protein
MLSTLKNWALLIGSGLIAILGAVAMVFRAQSKQHAAEAKQQTERADQTEAARKTVTKANDRLQTVRQRHRTERLKAKERTQAGKRDHFEEDWK